MSFFRRLFTHPRRHRKAQDMPGYIRRRMYQHLLDLVHQEREIAGMLDLEVPPRLSVVDEEWVAIIRPRDRDDAELDKLLQQVREEGES